MTGRWQRVHEAFVETHEAGAAGRGVAWRSVGSELSCFPGMVGHLVAYLVGYFFQPLSSISTDYVIIPVNFG